MNRGGSRISGKWVQISCVKRVEGGGGVVGFYLIFIPPPTRFGGYSDQPAWRPSVCLWKKLVRSITLIPFEIF